MGILLPLLGKLPIFEGLVVEREANGFFRSLSLVPCSILLRMLLLRNI
jgi:hypothetical protein